MAASFSSGTCGSEWGNVLLRVRAKTKALSDCSGSSSEELSVERMGVATGRAGSWPVWCFVPLTASYLLTMMLMESFVIQFICACE